MVTLPSPLVGEGAFAKAKADEGSLSAETDPSPVSNELTLIRSTLSHKGRGEAQRLTTPLFGAATKDSRPGICFDPNCGSVFGDFRGGFGERAMSLGTILVIILIIFLLGGFSGRFGGYGYGRGHSTMGLAGVILVVLLILLLLGKI